MTDEQIAALVNAEAVMTLAHIIGMMTTNKIRESDGIALAYREESFFYARDDLDAVLHKFNLKP